MWNKKIKEGLEPGIIQNIYNMLVEQDTIDKTTLLDSLKEELDYQEAERSEEFKKIGNQLIEEYSEELGDIEGNRIRVDYVISYERKKKNGLDMMAKCIKVQPEYLTYLPFDVIIILYEPNIMYLTNEQLKVLILHELLHIGISTSGIFIKAHDVEDFDCIIEKYGLKYVN